MYFGFKGPAEWPGRAMTSVVRHGASADGRKRARTGTAAREMCARRARSAM